MVEHLNSQAHVVPSVFTFQLHIGLEFGQPPSFLLYENPKVDSNLYKTFDVICITGKGLDG